MIKIRSSTKIAIGFVILVAVLWFGYGWISDYLVMREKFGPLVPGRINIVGINPGAGYRVIVANDVAQLVQTQGGFGGGGNSDDEGSTEGAIKKRISVKDILGTLQGDGKSLVSFVRSLNDLKEDDLPPIRVIWTADQIHKALNGDKAPQAKLEQDLNVKLDGTPLPSLRIHSLENGIVVQIPETVDVNMNGRLTPVTGQLLLPFKPRLIRAVEADYADKADVNNNMMAGYYQQESQKVLANPSSKEDIRKDLADMISPASDEERVAVAKTFLNSATIVVNDSLMEKASYDTYTAPNGKPLHDLTIDLNDEGRRRLAQFSKHRLGDQMLLTSDGVAIAAPRVTTPLFGGEVKITHMADQSLLDDFIATLNDTKTRVAQR